MIFVPLKSRVAGGFFSVTGQVVKPAASIPLRTNPRLSLREAMAFAGGTTVDADRKHVTVIRAGEAKPVIVDLDKAEHGDTSNNIQILPDDAVFVEKLASTGFVEVDGAFVKPGTKIPYVGQITLTEAIMQAGGPSPLAKTKEGVVIRHADDDPTHTTLVPFKWNDIVKKKAKDIALNRGDTIWMASSAPTGVAAKGMMDYMQMFMNPLAFLVRLNTTLALCSINRCIASTGFLVIRAAGTRSSRINPGSDADESES